MTLKCTCGSSAEARRIMPVWLIVVLLICGILPGVVALHCRNRLLACGDCERLRWKF